MRRQFGFIDASEAKTRPPHRLAALASITEM
jgi:hypothetical protein